MTTIYNAYFTAQSKYTAEGVGVGAGEGGEGRGGARSMQNIHTKNIKITATGAFSWPGVNRAPLRPGVEAGVERRCTATSCYCCFLVAVSVKSRNPGTAGRYMTNLVDVKQVLNHLKSRNEHARKAKGTRGEVRLKVWLWKNIWAFPSLHMENIRALSPGRDLRLTSKAS